MSMPITLDMVLVTEGKQRRIPEKPNCFKLSLDGYHLYPIDEIIEVKRHQKSGHIGYGEIFEITWKENQTNCLYRLTSLQSVN